MASCVILFPRSRAKKELACNLKIFFNFPGTVVVASLAQWLEHWSCKPEVLSSNLLWGSNILILMTFAFLFGKRMPRKCKMTLI